MKPNFIIVLLSTVALFVLFLVLSLVSNQDPKRGEEEDSDCDTENCRQTESPPAEDSTKACDSFYSSVCQKHSKQHQMSTEVYVNQKSAILNTLNESNNVNTSKAVSIVRRFYSLCQEVSPSEDHLKKILELFRECGGFPVLEGDTFDDSEWTLLGTTRKLRKFGLFTDSLFTTKLGSNFLDLWNTTFYIQHPRLDLALRGYCGKGVDCMLSFTNEFMKVVMKFGATREVAIKDGIELFDFEKKLLNMIWENPTESKEALAENQMKTVANLSSSFDFMNWTEYLTILCGSPEFVKEDLVVVVESLGYLRSLKQVLEGTPNRTLANFMMWSVLFRLEDYIPGNKRNALDCFENLQNTMSYALQSMYVQTIIRSNYTKSEKVIMQEAEEIKEQLIKRLRSSSWISEQTRTELVEKVGKIKIKVGYPQILLNFTFIDDYYEGLSLYDNALKSMLAVNKFHMDKYFNLCCRRLEEMFWDLSVEVFLPLVYYDSAQNSVHILEGALQDPILQAREMSPAEHFGRLGSMIGHEMVHAVDSIGGRYDVSGKRKRLSEDVYLTVFKERSQCFVDQYNNFMEFTAATLEQNPKISGEFKKLEIIGDSVGVDLSFAAYRRYLLYHSDVTTEDGRLTADRKFFRSFAQLFCVEYSADDLFQVLSDNLAPNPYRVDGALGNSEQFRKVFDCEAGSRMNPWKKCSLW